MICPTCGKTQLTERPHLHRRTDKAPTTEPTVTPLAAVSDAYRLRVKCQTCGASFVALLTVAVTPAETGLRETLRAAVLGMKACAPDGDYIRWDVAHADPSLHYVNRSGVLERIDAALASRTDSLDGLRALSDAATPGPWTRREDGYEGRTIVQEIAMGFIEVAGERSPADAAFIVAAVNSLRAEHAGRYQLVMVKEGSGVPLAEMLHDFAENAAMFGAFGGKWDEKAAAATILAVVDRQRAALQAIADGEGDSGASKTATRLARTALSKEEK